MARRISLATLLVTLVGLGFVAGFVVSAARHPVEETASPRRRIQHASARRARRRLPRRPPAPRRAVPAALPDLTGVAQRAISSVTNISSTQIVRRSNSPFENDPFFRYFFGNDDPFGARERRQLSLGSGVIVSSDGYLLTNNHVVGDAGSQVSVVLRRQARGPAKIVGVDEATDLAVLKIDARDLPVAAVGRLVEAQGRGMGPGDRQSVSAESDRDARHRLARPGRSLGGSAGDLRGLHPDRRGDQPGQLGRRADQRARRADRHQHGDLQRVGRLPGHRLRRAEQPRAARDGRPDEVRRGPARHHPGHPVRAADDADWPSELGAPNTRGALVYSDRSRDPTPTPPACVPGDIIVSFNGTHDRRSRRSSSGCCRMRRSAAP